MDGRKDPNPDPKPTSTQPAGERLLTPGPTPLPPEVREALGRPIIHHRTNEYRAIFREALEGLRSCFATTHPLYLLTSSGTGAMEAAVANLLSPGDRAVVILGGKFGERWLALCQGYGIEAVTIPVASGEAVDPEQVRDALRRDPEVKAVFATLCETSTGVAHDIEAVARIVRETPSVLVVDGISGFLAERCPTDAWGVDLLVTGSQKALMLPPGLAFLHTSPKAARLIPQSRSSRFYFDLRKYEKELADDNTPFTSSVSLVVALVEALRRIRARGVEAGIERCRTMAEATRAGARALGLQTFARRPANALTSIRVPEGIDAKAVVKRMQQGYGVRIAAGQSELAGTIVRIAHMGYIRQDDVLAALDALERSLADLGHPGPGHPGPGHRASGRPGPGAAVEAARRVFAGAPR
jgi:aspartate aminotransferase-like enzyme